VSPAVATGPFENLNLRPHPPVKQGLAFNSADALLVEGAAARGFSSESTLVVNDEFGALCVSMHARALWTDSFLSSISVSNNLLRNHCAPVKVIWSTDDLQKKLSQESKATCSTVVMRVPKQLPYFEYQLSQLSQCLPLGTVLLAAGMDKHLAPTTAELIEKYIGPVERHRGQRKARLFSSTLDDRQRTPYPGTSEYYCEALGKTLVSLPNVFARDKIDIGSRFLLEQLVKLEPVNKITDLACGNGIIGLTALSRQLCKNLLLCDESAMAIESARINACDAFPNHNIDFHHGDGLCDFTGEPAELILCNPPFHHNHRVDETVGRRLLVQAAAHLVEGGCLCMVGNRHLNYLPVLRREFGRVEQLAQNNKFIIWLAYR